MRNTLRFDNLQDELRRELAPKGFLEEEVFQSVVKAAHNRRWGMSSSNYRDDRAFFAALRELRALQARRTDGPRPPAKARRSSATVIMLPSLAA